MKRIIFAIVVAFIHTSVWPAESTPGQDKRLTLLVEVINGTTKGRPVVGDSVTVTIFEHGKSIDTLRGQVGPDGKAIFEDVRAGEHSVARANVLHQGMKFSGHPVALRPERQQLTILIDVFDVSYKNSSLSAKMHHLIIQQKDTSLLFQEFFQLVNSSDLAVSSNERDSQGKAIVLMVHLPKGYKNFSSSSYLVPEALVFTREGFYDTMAVPPGVHQVNFSYTIDITSDRMDIRKKFSLPTTNFVLFSQLAHDSIQGLGEPDGQVLLSDGTMAEYYNRNGLAADSEVVFKVAGLGTSAGNKTSWVVLAVIFAAITFLAVARAYFAKSRPLLLQEQARPRKSADTVGS
ncbi:MAG: hypothetical protein ACE5NM_01125 [Sedimentisphaerales bacterium]